jgi:opacity protein-like surface antigen
MKKLFMAATLSIAFVTAAAAEDTRDQAFGKHDMGPSTPSMNKPNSATGTQGMAGGSSGMHKTTKHSKNLDK